MSTISILVKLKQTKLTRFFHKENFLLNWTKSNSVLIFLVNCVPYDFLCKLFHSVMSSSTASSSATNEQQKIVNGFQKLRELQQATISELSKIETEHREHITVLKTVQALEPNRKCFRQVGDTLFEFKASELSVLLEETIKRFKQKMDELDDQVVKVGEDINKYKEKHNIRFLSNKDVVELQKKQALSKISQLDLGPGGKSQ